jgi:hypothetical protein
MVSALCFEAPSGLRLRASVAVAVQHVYSTFSSTTVCKEFFPMRDVMFVALGLTMSSGASRSKATFDKEA